MKIRLHENHCKYNDHTVDMVWSWSVWLIDGETEMLPLSIVKLYDEDFFKIVVYENYKEYDEDFKTIDEKYKEYFRNINSITDKKYNSLSQSEKEIKEYFNIK